MRDRSRISGLLVAVFCGLPFAAASLRAADFDPAVLQELPARMQAFVDDKTVSGLVAVIGSSDGIAATYVVGQQTIEPPVPMSVQSVFHIASMTKPIVGIAVLQQQERGRLNVLDPVEKHLPEFRGQMLAEKDPATGVVRLVAPPRPITIADLLTHTSGLPGAYPAGYADMYFSRQLTLKESILLQSQRPLDFPPGQKWSYCNAGIDTLGRIVEVTSGQSIEDYLSSQIFAPLGMHDTTFFLRADQRSRLAGIYDLKDGQLILSTRPLIGDPLNAQHPIPAGGLVSTGGDLAKLYRCLLNKGITPAGERIIQAETLADMTTNHTGDLTTGFVDGMCFGYAFAVVKQPKGVTEMMSAGSYGHGGAFGTQGWIDPNKDVFVILLLQRNGLPGGDGNAPRKVLQDVAYRALRSK